MSAQKKSKLEVRAVTSLRMKPSIKKALVKAAAAEKRTHSSLAEAILEVWLKEHGYLTSKRDKHPSPPIVSPIIVGRADSSAEARAYADPRPEGFTKKG